MQSATAARVLIGLCGDTIKKVPAFAFSAPDVFVHGMIDAFTAGPQTNCIDGFMLLLHRVGIVSQRRNDTLHMGPPNTQQQMNGVLLDAVKSEEVPSSHPFVCASH